MARLSNFLLARVCRVVAFLLILRRVRDRRFCSFLACAASASTSSLAASTATSCALSTRPSRRALTATPASIWASGTASGTPCWNGPVRSLSVSLSCAADNEILSVDEPEVCKYQMVFATPAVCTEEDVAAAAKAAQPNDGSDVDVDDIEHDEL
eukprot:6185332-Pleurochrysis_carterae.AAC.1